MIALLDGDIIAYQAASVATKDIDWGDGAGAQATLNLSGAVNTACRMIDDWTRLSGATSPVVTFSSRTGLNFRKHVDPTYKSGRRDKPALYWDLVDEIERCFKWHRIEGLEADDVMGILGTTDTQTVIVSLDKDMKTVPGRVFNPNNDRRPTQVSVAMADYHWMTQTLTGDPVDGYPGIPGVGPVKAAAILAEGGHALAGMWESVVDAYDRAGLTHDQALTQARLARILRSSDFNQQKGEISLWHLTKPTMLSLSALTVAIPTSVVASTPNTVARRVGKPTVKSGLNRSRGQARASS